MPMAPSATVMHLHYAPHAGAKRIYITSAMQDYILSRKYMGCGGVPVKSTLPISTLVSPTKDPSYSSCMDQQWLENNAVLIWFVM